MALDTRSEVIPRSSCKKLSDSASTTVIEDKGYPSSSPSDESDEEITTDEGDAVSKILQDLTIIKVCYSVLRMWGTKMYASCTIKPLEKGKFSIMLGDFDFVHVKWMQWHQIPEQNVYLRKLTGNIDTLL